MAIKILLVQTVNNNLGDPIIADNNRYLIKKAFDELGKECVILDYVISSRDFRQLKYVDAVIFAGGILKSSSERFWSHFSEIIGEASRHNKPVFLSSIGAEPYDNTERSLRLKNAINSDCVKGISCRDDIESLANGWITNENISVSSTMDPAIWCPYTYGISHAHKPSRTVIGIGVIRDDIFSEYGHPEIDRKYLFDFWKQTAIQLENEGYDWVLFSNGSYRDEAVARDLINYIGHGKLLPAPADNKELVKNINSMSGVIACRMHSNIIAYSLKIPSIGVIWNQKLRFWGEKTGYPERMLTVEQLKPEIAVSRLNEALKEDISEISEEKYSSSYDALKGFISEWCIKEDRSDRPFSDISAASSISSKLTAFGLGAIEKKNSVSNSKEAFEYSYEHGFRNFKTDLRLTKDNILVCINKWERATLNDLGYAIEEKSKTLSYDEFINSKWFDRFTPMSFESLASLLKKYDNNDRINMILDIGKPSKDAAVKIFDIISGVLNNSNFKNISFYLKIEQEKDFDIVKEKNILCDVIYLFPDTNLSELSPKQKDTIYYCLKNNIKHLAVKPGTYNNAVKQAFSDFNIKAYIISTEKAGQIIDLITDDNVRFIGSIRYEPDHIISLIS